MLEAVATVAGVIEEYWLSDYSDEPGARVRRVKWKFEDKEKGTAAAYVAKYIAKGTDALDDDDLAESDLPGDETAARVVAWSRIHGIRQFQQVGGPSVGMWRELRRLKEPVDVPEIERARVANSKPVLWHEFINALSGIERCRTDPTVTIDKAPPREIDGTGRLVLRLTAYGELPADRPIGVKCVGPCERIRRVVTRPHCWRIVRRAVPAVSTRSSGPSGRPDSFPDSSLFFRPWTCGNNCTRPRWRWRRATVGRLG